MSAILIMLIALVLLALGYIFYGSFLAKQWGVDPAHETPAHTSYDGKDFVPANPAVLMGHHFSSIAGAGPINGPIQAAVFGWVPVFLWVVVGGIFFGAMHDFGALFASIRHNGGSIGEVIKAQKKGTLNEAFGTGTAAVVSPVGLIRYRNVDYPINGGKMGEITKTLYDTITGIQYGTLPDPYGWRKIVK